MTERGAETRPGGRVLSYEEAFRAARAAFLRDGRLEMDELAASLAVSRATLYRIVGGRDRLLGDVIAWLAEETLRRSVGATRAHGIDRIIEIATMFKEQVATFEPLQNLLRSDPDTGFRVLFTPAGGVHERVVRAWSRIFTEAAEQGELELPLPPDDLAYIFVRVGESMLYADMFVGRPPDIELASYVQRLLLRS